MKKTTKLKGKYIEDYTKDDIEELNVAELRIFYILIQLYLLEEINELVMGDLELKQAKDLLSKFNR
ncbi:hypothetical protein EB118_22365 [bacterium]|nr:hypothetical protein [bacterium]